jgi:hypothetical protein
MAHAGKDWPLHFRRDLSAQALNNRQGWAEQYVLTFARLAGSIGTFIRDESPKLFTTFLAGTTTMEADTAPFVTNGHTVFARLHFELAGSPQVYSGTMSIFDSVKGQVYRESWVTLIPGDYQFFGRDHSGVTELETPMICVRDFSADLFESEAEAVPWP